MNFTGIKVLKAWGHEIEVFNNNIISCWYLRINAGHETSLHMHEKKETALILLNGHSKLQDSLTHSRSITALDKTRFSARHFHRNTAISDCDFLEVETPIDKLDVYRFKDSYGRAGKPYESSESFAPLGKDDPQFDGHGSMRIGDASLKTFGFISASAFIAWVKKLRDCQCVILSRGVLKSVHGVEMVLTGDINWSHNLKAFLEEGLTPDDYMEAILVSRAESKSL